jgi:hypothetical protein
MYATSSRDALRVREVNITIMQCNGGTGNTLDRAGLSESDLLLTRVELHEPYISPCRIHSFRLSRISPHYSCTSAAGFQGNRERPIYPEVQNLPSRKDSGSCWAELLLEGYRAH